MKLLSVFGEIQIKAIMKDVCPGPDGGDESSQYQMSVRLWSTAAMHTGGPTVEHLQAKVCSRAFLPHVLTLSKCTKTVHSSITCNYQQLGGPVSICGGIWINGGVPTEI